MDSYQPKKGLLEVLKNAPDALLLTQANSEAWFSNQLAWLLDPKGSHGLGTVFTQAFISLVIEKRRVPESALGKKQSSLEESDVASEVMQAAFNINNCAVLREFYLSKSNKRRRDTGFFCDIVLADLDSDDGLFLTIENKLYTTDHKGQLEGYQKKIEEKFIRVKVKEYVYLTLEGCAPKYLKKRPNHKGWVSVSWLEDIRGLIQSIPTETTKHASKALDDFLELLNWMSEISLFIDNSSEDLCLDIALINSAKECLIEELRWLGEGKRGQWNVGSNDCSIQHSSRSSVLHLTLLPGLSVAIQGKSKKKTEFEKILIPFGAQPDQVFNLLDLAARDIYHLFFNDPTLYLNKDRCLQGNVSCEKAKWNGFLNFIYTYRAALPFVLVMDAMKEKNSRRISMAKEISVVGNKKIDTLKKEFNGKFPHLLLALFPLSEKDKKTKTPYDSNKTISEVRTKVNPGNMSLHGLTKVKNLEKDFDEFFGLYAQVCYIKADGGRFFTSGKYDEMSLSELNNHGNEQGWAKNVWA